jgi:transposase
MDTTAQASIGRQPSRRHRTREERRRIVEETFSSGSSVATVARLHGVNANQVFHWRKLYEAGLLGSRSGETQASDVRLLAVTVSDESAHDQVQEAAPAETSTGAVHIELADRALISVVGFVDPVVIRAVLESLRG